MINWWFPQWLSGKESTYNTESAGDKGSILGSGRSPGGGYGNPLQYSCLENPMNRGAWCASAPGVTKSQTRLKWLSRARHMISWASKAVEKDLTIWFVPLPMIPSLIHFSSIHLITYSTTMTDYLPCQYLGRRQGKTQEDDYNFNVLWWELKSLPSRCFYCIFCLLNTLAIVWFLIICLSFTHPLSRAPCKKMIIRDNIDWVLFVCQAMF